MNASVSFDKHSNIAYSDLTHLFWGEFPYKVSINLPKGRGRPLSNPNSVTRALAGLLDEVQSDRELVFRKKKNGYSFFFETEEEAALFIDLNAEMIDSVVRPRNAGEVDALRDTTVRIRTQLWYSQYRCVVSFKGETWREGVQTTEEVDAFVADTFFSDDADTGRARYTEGKRSTRRLYLRDEMDLILVKLALDSDKIDKIEIAKTRGNDELSTV